MEPPVTPSPTPSADGLLAISPSPQGTRGIIGTPYLAGMDPSKNRRWRYSTPPFDVPLAQISSWTTPQTYSSPVREVSASVGRNSRGVSSNRTGTKVKAHDSRPKKSMALTDESVLSRKIKPQLKVPKLEQPLSEWVLQLPEVSVENIEEYVNRSLEERQQEAVGAGKVKRELNPFLLYRKAHKNVAEALIRTSSDDTSYINPRISKLCGVSWKTMESSSVRAQYEIWSKIEKERLKEAFPDYRYQPNKKQREDNFGLSVSDNCSQMNSLEGRQRSQRDFTPDMPVFSQTPPSGADEAKWSQDYDSPGDFWLMDFTPPPQQPQQMHVNYMDDSFQHDYTGSPSWCLPTDRALHSHPQTFAPHYHWDSFRYGPSSSIDGLDPRLFYSNPDDAMHYQAAAEATEHVPPGQYLLSTPTKMSQSRVSSPEPLGQPWATSIPGNDLANDFLSGPVEDWEFGAG